jgi:hypothetical protein
LIPPGGARRDRLRDDSAPVTFRLTVAAAPCGGSAGSPLESASPACHLSPHRAGPLPALRVGVRCGVFTDGFLSPLSAVDTPNEYIQPEGLVSPLTWFLYLSVPPDPVSGFAVCLATATHPECASGPVPFPVSPLALVALSLLGVNPIPISLFLGEVSVLF